MFFMNVLIFGASITQGFWDTHGGWAQRLRTYYDELQLQDLGKAGLEFFNLGISGNSSHDLLQRIEGETKARSWRNKLPIVMVEIGTNDSSVDHGAIRVPLETYRANLEELIKKAAPLSSKLIFVGLPSCDETRTTPVSWGDYRYTNESIERYEHAAAEVVKAHNLPFIPIFGTFKAKLDAGEDLLTDGLHPNNEGHQFIFEVVRQG